jgi:phosphoribosylformylglycinamidine synthase subunit PurQ / glutaminase
MVWVRMLQRYVDAQSDTNKVVWALYICPMKAGVVIFPGSNCDQDLIQALQQHNDMEVVSLWHKDTDLQGCTHIFIPGGFSYGDYLRSGAIAKLSPIMESVKTHAAQGGFVMGICNGFQVLTESGLLPEALLRNENMKFVCKNVYLKTCTTDTAITRSLASGQVLQIPIAHGEGRYYADAETMDSLKKNDQILFQYCDSQGSLSGEANPNGSLDHIAGICNEGRNVFGMMPHPERCAFDWLLNLDGTPLLKMA